MWFKSILALCFLTLLISLTPGMSFACTVEQTTEDSASAFAEEHGQSFTAPCTGKLVSIRINCADGLIGGTFVIRSGEDIASSPDLTLQGFDSYFQGNNTISLVNHLEVTNGEMYTFLFLGSWGTVRENSAGGYAGGRAWSSGGFKTSDLDFTVTIIPNPTMTSITPSTGKTDETVNITDLSGTDFQSGATVKLQKTGETDITATNITVVSPTHITCTFDLTGAATGDWDVVVLHNDGTTGTLATGFTVTVDPTVTSITPSTGTNDGPVNITDLSGTDFQSGATVKLQKTGETDITATNVTKVSPTSITCTFDLTGAAAGDWDVVVSHNDGTSGSLAASFTVSEASNDFDNDGMPNDWETQYGLNPNDPSDAGLDGDGDFYTNLEEYTAGSDPTDPDSTPLSIPTVSEWGMILMSLLFAGYMYMRSRGGMAFSR